MRTSCIFLNKVVLGVGAQWETTSHSFSTFFSLVDLDSHVAWLWLGIFCQVNGNVRALKNIKHIFFETYFYKHVPQNIFLLCLNVLWLWFIHTFFLKSHAASSSGTENCEENDPRCTKLELSCKTAITPHLVSEWPVAEQVQFSDGASIDPHFHLVWTC